MVSLTQNPRNGSWTARKAIPEELRARHAERFGQRHEVVLRLHASTPEGEARAKFAAWLAEVEARMQNLRAELRGTGRTLDVREARRLGAQWFESFIRKGLRAGHTVEHWEGLREALGRAWDDWADVDDDEDEHASARIQDRYRSNWRALLADTGEVDLFLAEERLRLTEAGRAALVDQLEHDLPQALKLLEARSGGFMREAEAIAQGFRERRGSGRTISDLVEKWRTLRQPDGTTVQRWRPVFRSLEDHFQGRGPDELTADDARVWRDKVLSDPSRARRTAKEVWLNAAHTLFSFAEGEGLLKHNPFRGIARNVSIPTPPRTRDRKFNDGEAALILNAALRVDPSNDRRGSRYPAAKRWAPWLAAYSGSRIGDLLQLTTEDLVADPEAGWTLRIRPETEKTETLRWVPVHEHLVELGFVEFVQGRPRGELFFVPERFTGEVKGHQKVRTKLGSWVRKVGVTSKEISPNHAWRHTFKSRAMSAGIDSRFIDRIVGHAPETVGRAYEHPTMSDLRRAIDKYPRFLLGE